MNIFLHRGRLAALRLRSGQARFVALFLVLLLSMPSPAMALRSQGVDAPEEDGPKTVRAGLEGALKDPEETAWDFVHLAQAALFPQHPSPSIASPAAGLESRREPPIAEMEELETFELGPIPLTLVRHGFNYYLQGDQGIFPRGSRDGSLHLLPLKENVLVTIGSGSGNDVQVARNGVSDRHAALLLDFGGSVRLIHLDPKNSSRGGQRELLSPIFFRIGTSTFFIFQRGNRYFIAGDHIVGPTKVWVPYQEIPFHEANDLDLPTLRAQATVGREESNDIEIGDQKVSMSHAQLLLLNDGSVLIKDLESRNGTRVNGQPISKPALLYSPLYTPTQVELAAAHSHFGFFQDVIRRIMFLNPDEDPETIARHARRLNRMMARISDPDFPFDLALAATRGALEDHDNRYTVAMEAYLEEFMAQFLRNIHRFGQGEQLSPPFAIFLLYFLMDERYPKLQYEVSFAFRDMILPTGPDQGYTTILARLVSGETARRYFDRILIQSLGRQGGLGELIRLLQEGEMDERLRLAALRILRDRAREAPEEQLLTLLPRLLYDESRPVVLAAMDIYERLGNPEAAFYLSTYAFPRIGQTPPDPEIQARAEALFHRFVESWNQQLVSKIDPTAAGLEAQQQADEAAVDAIAQRFQGTVLEILSGQNLDSSALDLGSVPVDARGVILETTIGDVLPVAMALHKRNISVVVVERAASSLQVTTALLNGTGILVAQSLDEALAGLEQLGVSSPIILTPVNASNVQAAIQLLLKMGFLLQGDIEPLLAAGMEEARSRQEIERYYQ